MSDLENTQSSTEAKEETEQQTNKTNDNADRSNEDNGNDLRNNDSNDVNASNDDTQSNEKVDDNINNTPNNNITSNEIENNTNNTGGPDQSVNNNNPNNNTGGPDQSVNNNNHTDTSETTTFDETTHTMNTSNKVDVNSHTNMDELQGVVEEEVNNANTYVKTEAIDTIKLGDSHNVIEYTHEKKVYEDKTIQQEHIGSHNDDDSHTHDYTTNSTKVQSQRPTNQQLQTSKLFYIFMAFVILIPAYFYSLDKKPTFLQNVAETANTITIGISDIEVPDINIMNNHIVALRRVANTIDRSSVFKSYGPQIAIGLREYGEKIRDASSLIRKMYSKGSSVHTSFDIEIEAMIQTVKRLNSRNLRYIQDEDARYFKERLERLITKIKDFRRSVEVAHNSILGAEEIKRNNEVAIENGFKEAEKFSDNEKYSIEISKASNELASVNNFLPYLHTASGQLDKLKTILKNYEDNLRDVSNELDEENGVRFTMSELKILQHSIDNAKASQHKFNQFAQISD